MESGARLRRWSNLASTRRDVCSFVRGLTFEHCTPARRQNWASSWVRTGDDYQRKSHLDIEEQAFDEATEALLCALTAFEVARRLLEDDRDRLDVEGKVEAAIQSFGVSLGGAAENLEVGFDHTILSALYLPGGAPKSCCPAVICLSSDEDKRTMLLGRLLPLAIKHGMSVLIVAREELVKYSPGESKILLSLCLDHLSSRTEVDRRRIGVYGDGLSAEIATNFAAFDKRVAAAVCDGGLWSSARTLASIGWITGAACEETEEEVSPRRSRVARRLDCPALVVAGGRGLVSVSEAIKLHADCTAEGIPLDLMLPEIVSAEHGEYFENFVMSDDCIFDWLDRKLKR
ncbi:hypothetical protein ABIB81_008281 [Bradyrhizobium sp. I1.7.5]